MLQIKRFLCAILFLYACMSNVQAQSRTVSYDLKKGEVFDILFLQDKLNINKDSLFGLYVKTLFPIGTEFTFQPVKGLKVNKTLQGGHQVDLFAFGKWANLEKRLAFIDEVVRRVPAFHDMRRGLWSSLGLVYYEMQEDLKFTVDLEKYNVATAYWLKEENKASEKFLRKWKKICVASGGKIVVQFEEGGSPLGYYYNPDQLFFTEWENSADYEKFIQVFEKLDSSCLNNINEFEL